MAIAFTDQYEVGTDQQVCVCSESDTYGTFATPAATDAQYFLKCLIKTTQEKRDTKDRKQNRSRYQYTRGHRNVEVEIDQYLRGGEPADDDVLMEAIFEKTTTTDTAVKSSGSDSTDQFRVDTPGNLSANTFCLWENSDGDLEARFITLIDDTDQITVTPPFSAAPQDGDDIYGCVTYSPQERQQTKSLSVHSKGTNSAMSARGFVPSVYEFNGNGSDDGTQKFVGPAADAFFCNRASLAAPMKANYAFSQNGDDGDPTSVDGTHKTFKISARNATSGEMDSAEDCTLAGTEQTWAAIVSYLNNTVFPGLSGTTNKTCVAVAIGTGDGTGMYIRPATTGNGRDIVLTPGSSNDCTAILELGVDDNGYEADADEMTIDDTMNASVYSIVEIDDENLQITAIDASEGVCTVTRAFNGTSAAAHDIDATVDPYYPDSETLTDSQPISGIDGGVMIAHTASKAEVTAINFRVDEKVKTFNNQIGKTVADYFDRTGRREVSGSMTVEAGSMNLMLRNFERMYGIDVDLSIMVQLGVASGSVRGCYCPKIVFPIDFEYDQGQDEQNIVEVPFDCFASSTGGGNEIYFFTH